MPVPRLTTIYYRCIKRLSAVVETHRLWLALLWNALSLWWKTRVRVMSPKYSLNKIPPLKTQILSPNNIFAHLKTSQPSSLIPSGHNLVLDGCIIFPERSSCVMHTIYFPMWRNTKCNQQTAANINNHNSSKLCLKLECASTSCGFTDFINRKTEKFVWKVINGCGR